ncbi:unnamed protein product [Larinioides sclopetarius]|uniref:Maturase K n=1 Tax=Larinioides sclopetarius TaxID=280406 RepID=A0AAV2AY24_9ARAC
MQTFSHIFTRHLYISGIAKSILRNHLGKIWRLANKKKSESLMRKISTLDRMFSSFPGKECIFMSHLMCRHLHYWVLEKSIGIITILALE